MSQLRDVKEHYKVVKDERGTWRILDLWHDDLKNFDFTNDVDIPDSSPAVTIVTEGQFVSLFQAAAREGYIENATLREKSVATNEHQELLEKVKIYIEENEEFKTENEKLKRLLEEKKNPPHSESFELKKISVEAILRLSGMHDLKE